MTEQDQIRRIKCPHCGWISKVPAKAIEDASLTTVVKGVTETIADLAAKIKTLLSDPALDEANAWLAHKCPNCGNVYEYNVRSAATRK